MSWAVCLQATEATTLKGLRTVPGLRILLKDESIWLQGAALTPDLEQALRALPAQRFHVLEDGQLLPWGRKVPQGHLPQGEWHPLQEAMRIALDTPLLCGAFSKKVAIRLVRSEEPREANLLLTGLKSWHDYAIAAPQARLALWTFAVSNQQEALIRGKPLPPLSGKHYVEENGIAVPAGWTWWPPVEVEVLRELFNLEGKDLILSHSDGGFDRISEGDFVQCGRAAVRLTFKEYHVEQ